MRLCWESISKRVGGWFYSCCSVSWGGARCLHPVMRPVAAADGYRSPLSIFSCVSCQRKSTLLGVLSLSFQLGPHYRRILLHSGISRAGLAFPLPSLFVFRVLCYTCKRQELYSPRPLPPPASPRWNPFWDTAATSPFDLVGSWELESTCLSKVFVSLTVKSFLYLLWKVCPKAPL